MSKEKRSNNNFKVSTRPSWEELGMSKERARKLQKRCKAGIYPSEMLSKACAEFKFIEAWIILSVTENKSYDTIEFNAELGRIPVGRSDFYGARRKFYYNLDVILREKCSA